MIIGKFYITPTYINGNEKSLGYQIKCLKYSYIYELQLLEVSTYTQQIMAAIKNFNLLAIEKRN